MKCLAFALVLVLSLLGFHVQAQSKTADEQGVRAAILDYVEAFYQGDTARAIRSVRPDLAKRGFYASDGGTTYQELYMSFAQLVRLSQQWYKTARITPTTPREITIYEVQDQTATAKVRAEWGTDYFHLARYNGRWMIVNVLWQSAPKAK
ncbi:nuclear transport factor 2 family protein [Hymenobacter sp. HD11105]